MRGKCFCDNATSNCPAPAAPASKSKAAPNEKVFCLISCLQLFHHTGAVAVAFGLNAHAL